MAPCRTSGASKAKPTRIRSSRASKKKQRQRKSRKERAEAKRCMYQERGNQVLRDYVRLPNGLKLELPEEEDLVGISRVPNKRHYSKIQEKREELGENEEREVTESLKADKPHIPDPYDDNLQRPYWKTRRNAEQEQDEEQEENRGQERDHEPCRPAKRARKAPPPEHVIQKTPPTFMGIPREIRMQIYRHLLTAAKPIPVHGGWKQVYWTKDLQISAKILSVSRIVHEEASVVLYGANTFLYRLRDANFNGVYIDSLAMDDEAGRNGEDDGESEYEDDLEQDDEDDDDGPVVADRERSINIERYAHLFRHITIEAEANRYSAITQDSMVAAMDVFRKPLPGQPASSSRSIHTLTVCIMPLFHQQQDGSSQSRFTFVDFFQANSPVIQAIKAVDCQVLHVDILTRHASRRSAHVTVKGSGSCRLTINRRHEQAMDFFKGQMAGDKAVRRRTAEMAKRSVEAIDTLAKHIEEQCDRRHFDQATTMDMDVDSLDYWLDLDGLDDQDDDDDGV
ncbi:uncharacterized protein Triagg1_6076 [Trichoderma aggressivum f. europaeum]|uniref:Uncharacterized protein n=1 Tax=Trichoderma aggressivum f. europaeum TaxID=173218 RepID=A0AAE1ID97_9HYPO|nr:hypothetical protein Triagg1_6076 [Trichoderma aggressivum f. europaeum]